MRKSVFLTLLLALAVVVSACGQPAAAPATTAPSQPQAQPTTAPVAAQPTTAPAAQPTTAPAGGGEKVTLTIESWRNDDVKIWSDMIIPAFEKSHPNIHVVFQPTAPADYNAALNTKLTGGTAGDLITCRPFDASLALFQKGYLTSLNDLPGLNENFGSVAKSAWVTDDGKTVFCVPMASVIHGFMYNADAFAKLNLKVPQTVDQFFQVVDAIKKDGTYTAIDMGTSDQWESATMGFQNIGPKYWKGEDGRLALIKGTAKFTDKPYIDTWAEMARWIPYLPQGYQSQKYADSQQLFTLGKAAIYPTGSWEIGVFEPQINGAFKMDAFPPPLLNAGDQCYISDHTDIAMGMNAATKHPQEVRAFLQWMTTQEFAELYSNALPGFFTLSNYKIQLKDPLAQKFLDWRQTCKSTIRNSYQILSRGTPNLENELWRVSAGVLNGTITPPDAGKQIQDGLDKWYKPAQSQ